MMNGMQKSDSVIVAVKPANKGAFVLAEPMERRTGPEGNPEGQSMRQTQDWESVSQATDRIRQFVKRDPRERLTTLLHVNGGAKLVHPGGAKLVHLTLCGTRCWGVVPVVHRRDPRCFE